MGVILSGPPSWTRAALDPARAEVIDLFGAGDPHNFAPRSSFGLRKVEIAGGVGKALDIARAADDRSAVQRIKAAALRAKEAIEGKHVCPTLLVALAAEGNAIAESARRLSDKLAAIGQFSAAQTFNDLAEHAETAAALVEAPAHEGDI